jgi:4-amino-4-deoxychorismate lyase
VSAESALRDGNATGFDLIETLRWESGSGFMRLERHLARLYGSAAALGFACEPEEVGQALASAVAASSLPQRVRLVLAKDGTADATAQPFEPLAAGKVWHLRLARVRLVSADTLLRHKTTRRDVYVRARAEYLSTQADEVLLMNERGEVCEGTITSLFADFGDGVLATPCLDCGLLPGVLRGEMLDDGRAVEAVISVDALKAAKAIFVGNSLRGLIPARLA